MANQAEKAAKDNRSDAAMAGAVDDGVRAALDRVRVVLISQAGDRNTMAALYDIMQTLQVVPLSSAEVPEDWYL